MILGPWDDKRPDCGGDHHDVPCLQGQKWTLSNNLRGCYYPKAYPHSLIFSAFYEAEMGRGGLAGALHCRARPQESFKS